MRGAADSKSEIEAEREGWELSGTRGNSERIGCVK